LRYLQSVGGAHEFRVAGAEARSKSHSLPRYHAAFRRTVEEKTSRRYAADTHGNAWYVGEGL